MLTAYEKRRGLPLAAFRLSPTTAPSRGFLVTATIIPKFTFPIQLPSGIRIDAGYFDTSLNPPLLRKADATFVFHVSC